MAFIDKMVDKTATERLRLVASTPFKRLTYTEAIEILEEVIKSKKKKFVYPVRTPPPPLGSALPRVLTPWFHIFEATQLLATAGLLEARSPATGANVNLKLHRRANQYLRRFMWLKSILVIWAALLSTQRAFYSRTRREHPAAAPSRQHIISHNADYAACLNSWNCHPSTNSTISIRVVGMGLKPENRKLKDLLLVLLLS